MSDASSPSAASLIYLFADQVIDPDKGLSRGAKVPCSDKKVKRRDLTAGALSSAFWQLRDMGAISLEVVEVKKLLRRVKEVRVQTMGSPQVPPFVGKVLEAVGTEPSDLKSASQRFMGGTFPDPDAEVLHRLGFELRELGYMRVDESTGMLKRMSKIVEFVPDCAKIATLQPAFDHLLPTWRSFQTTETDLYERLMDITGNVIANSIDTD